MAVESIAKTLGTGSGIDITSLVTSLVEAQFAAKTATLTRREETLTAQVSAAASLKNGITGFDTALKTLIATGSLAAQASSSNTGVVRATALSGANVTGLNTSIEVRQLASAQTASAAPIADKTAPIGTGKLTLTFGTATVIGDDMTGFVPGNGTPLDIDIVAGKSNLEGIRDAINAKNAGVTASILTDADGSRLVIKGGTGGSQAFTLTATEDAGAEGLAALDIGVGASGTSIGATAQDAIVAVDGIAVRRLSNSILDLVPGVKLDLVSASVGTRVSLGAQTSTTALNQAVTDVVDTYNELLASLKTATDPVAGPLRADPAAKAMLRSLGSLTTSKLTDGDASQVPTTLAAIGVATNRDGTLRVDTARLTKSLADHSGSVEAMFGAGKGLSAALSSISLAASSTAYGLGASETRYTRAQTVLTDDKLKVTTSTEALRTRMTRQFAGMDAIVASYKSTQTFLENQIDAWTSND